MMICIINIPTLVRAVHMPTAVPRFSLLTTREIQDVRMTLNIEEVMKDESGGYFLPGSGTGKGPFAHDLACARSGITDWNYRMLEDTSNPVSSQRLSWWEWESEPTETMKPTTSIPVEILEHESLHDCQWLAEWNSGVCDTPIWREDPCLSGIEE